MPRHQLRRKLRFGGSVFLLAGFLFVLVSLIVRRAEYNSLSSGLQNSRLSSATHLLRLQGTGTYTNYNRDGTPHTNGAIGSVTFLTDFTNWTVAYASGNDPLKEEMTFLDAGCYHVTRNDEGFTNKAVWFQSVGWTRATENLDESLHEGCRP